QDDETERPEHRGLEADRSTPHRGEPREYFDARRHGDDHRRDGEIGPRVDVKAYCIHVVRPDDETDETDRHHRISHAEIAEDRLFAESRDDLTDDAESGQDHDVYFRVPEEPEQVLE